jgi:hypothetical protein
MVDRVTGNVSGEVAHIRAKSSGGPRYDQGQSAQERDAFDNLLLLCPLHHQIVDADVQAYTVVRLTEMKRDHEGAADDAGEITDPLAERLINIGEARVSAGSIIVTSAQAGGQVAHVITNIYSGQPPAVASPTSSRPPAVALEAEALRDLWDAFQQAFGAVFQVSSPLQYFDDPGQMNNAQFEEFLRKVDLLDHQKQELRETNDRTRYYAKIDHQKKLVFARSKRIEFHNLLVKHRIVLSGEIKDALTTADNEMMEALSKMELVLEDGDRSSWRESFTLVRATEEKIPGLEKLISDRLRHE